MFNLFLLIGKRVVCGMCKIKILCDLYCIEVSDKLKYKKWKLIFLGLLFSLINCKFLISCNWN